MQTFSIGRTTENNIIINDQFISRQHAHLNIMDNGQVLLKDLDSSNGTFVNGNRITETFLQPGDIVKCAGVFLNWQQYTIPADAFTRVQAAEMNTIIDVPSQNQEYTSYQTDTTVQRGVSRPIHQQNVVVVGKAKSVGAAFFLAFFFGPLGLFYASVTGGIIMLILTIPIIIITLGIGFFFINPICAIWAVIAANQANSALRNRAGGLINNNYN